MIPRNTVAGGVLLTDLEQSRDRRRGVSHHIDLPACHRRLAGEALDRIGATVRYEYVSHNQTDNLVNLGLSYSHRLSETLEAVVLYSFTNQFSTSEDDRFRENVVTVGLVKTFQ